MGDDDERGRSIISLRGGLLALRVDKNFMWFSQKETHSNDGQKLTEGTPLLPLK